MKIFPSTLGFFVAACSTTGCMKDPSAESGAFKPGFIETELHAAAPATKTVYEFDPSAGTHRAVWCEGDQLAVVTHNEEGETEGGWKKFTMSGDFDKFNASFSGEVYWSGQGKHTLYALYPFWELTESDKLVTIPTRQYNSNEGFDPAAALMFSRPVACERKDDNILTSPLEFRHLNGFLRLNFVGLPDKILKQKINAVDFDVPYGEVISGTRIISVENGEPVFSDFAQSNIVSLDMRERNLTGADLRECWFTLAAGNYETVRITVYGEDEAVSFQRSGLVIKSGVIKAQTIRFKTESDEVFSFKSTLLTGDALNLNSTMGTKNRTVDNITFRSRNAKKTLGNIQLFNGSINNENANPAYITEIRKVIVTATKNTVGLNYNVGFSADSASDYTEFLNGGDTVTIFSSGPGRESKYFKLTSHTQSDSNFTLASVIVVYKTPGK